MEEIKFDSLNDLYNRLYPAFNTKKNELKDKGIFVREIDIWNYLKENIWHSSLDLELYMMVSDIFSLDEIKLKSFVNKTK